MTRVSTVPPPASAPRPYRFPVAQRSVIGSGTRLVVAPLTKAPLVSVSAVFHRGGADHDPPDREGLAELTALMLLEGNDARDGAALADYFESLGSSLAAAADWDSAIMSFTVHPDRLDAAMRAFREVLRAPAFPQRELDRIKAEHHADRMQASADPRSLANDAFAWSCYGDNVRYRRPAAGTSATVESITREDVESFWGAQYSPGDLTLIFAGALDNARAAALAEELTAGWVQGAPESRTMLVTPRYREPAVTLIEKPGAAQAELRIGHMGVPRAHAGYFPLTVMNAVLGGLFSSRINLNLRERHGYTYGASSGFDWRKAAGPWLVSTAVKTEVCAAAIREVLGEIDRIRTAEVEKDELDLAAQYLVGVFPLRFETTAAVAGALVSHSIFGLPPDYFDTYRERVSAVTPGDALRAAQDHLHRDQLQIVVVGDPAGLRADLLPFARGQIHSVPASAVESAP
ncbi:MAG TPA: pitrilysin family protein [Gemmatimonadaceae bacterium]|nr:pitrilysin family protein [Gemmatimonadaceae bacterium]